MTMQEKLEIINDRCDYNKYNRLIVTELAPGKCVVEGELRPEALNSLGMAHGGFVFSLCDVAAGVAVQQNGCTGVTLSSNMYFMRPSKGKKLRCEGIIIKSGRTVSVVETTVYDDAGRMTARGSFEVYITSNEPHFEEK